MPVHPHYDPETDDIVYHVAPSHHAESISDIISESDSSLSAVTISSDEVDSYFITQHGRLHPASENALRWFPSDNTKREILRHVVDKYAFGHNYMGPVKEILHSNPGEGRQHHLLEIGTRSGSWVQEMATEFPHVRFQSLDIAPLLPHMPRSNVVFEVYDIAEGLLVEDNSQDVVFINAGLQMVKNYQALLLEVHRVLRPGGLVEIREFDPGVWNPKEVRKPAQETNPIACRFFESLRNAIKESGSEPDTSKVHRWLSSDSELWKNGSQPRGFERIYPTILMLPPHPHVGHPCTSRIAPHMVPLIGHFISVCTRDSAGLLCAAGLSAEEAKSLAEAMVEELKNPSKCPVLKLYCVYATKKGGVTNRTLVK
ncbi:hypothetical protein BDV93DRAFT_541072 [Ceratobasidium sp. AG-I]|nr:hypothetical protein BDV93DRAFT_541072 [Ceratobasidium sp. AG-I]